MKFWLTAALAACCVFPAVGDVIDYANTSYPEQPWYAHPAFLEIADDVMRISSEPITAIDFGYSAYDTDPLSLRLRFYEFQGTGGPFPPPLVAEYFFGGLAASQGSHFVHLELGSPLLAPQHLWVGVSFSDTAGWLYYAPPTIGASADYYLADYSGDDVVDALVLDDQPIDSFYLAIHSVPEPSSIGVMTLAMFGFATCRRTSR